METVFALSSAEGKAGVAIIRISGPDAFKSAKLLCGDLPQVRKPSVRELKASDGTQLDEALIVLFDKNHSFTGDETVELHLHGSPAIVTSVLAELSLIDELSPANPGDFTRRALENGRLDLSQVEGLADLIDSETEAQRRQAIRVFKGEFADKTEGWRKKLIRAAALIEATIDFADEEVPTDVSPEVNALIDHVVSEIQDEINGVKSAERIRLGFEVAIVGAPNVGKSTLLNRIAGREAAITSEYAGTTRDVIEVRMDLGGLPVTFLDTAGLRETDDFVESIGIDRARERAQMADLCVFLKEEDQKPEFDPRPDDIILTPKADIQDNENGAISGKTGFGVTALLDRISTTLKLRSSNAGLATRIRHQEAMISGVKSLRVAQNYVNGGGDVAEFAAEEIRSAVRALDSLVGRIGVENLLDEIFASFCLGK
ncbi:tRNA uridine-5-carboxymethylaminomethyl(34) synthesis GTPase MnmE [Roseovarius sp. EL26]|uniref:tRNA uridine-5-carboxymethylaminomethyl(34) synthesis GTPase MnmE n=1 Tax=Roseovarius sp. EL26 TaxID=2126672 RepID=UPI000EA0C205|nr:tRNA uridine-5-carboxymethylaminomethyl(34) synthesis GTPase MnmE [Roseovarius sp. EL26]